MRLHRCHVAVRAAQPSQALGRRIGPGQPEVGSCSGVALSVRTAWGWSLASSVVATMHLTWGKSLHCCRGEPVESHVFGVKKNTCGRRLDPGQPEVGSCGGVALSVRTAWGWSLASSIGVTMHLTRVELALLSRRAC